MLGPIIRLRASADLADVLHAALDRLEDFLLDVYDNDRSIRESAVLLTNGVPCMIREIVNSFPIERVIWDSATGSRSRAAVRIEGTLTRYRDAIGDYPTVGVETFSPVGPHDWSALPAPSPVQRALKMSVADGSAAREKFSMRLRPLRR